MLSTENPEKYVQLKAEYFAYWKAESVFETDLVNDIAIGRWRLNRLLTNETAAIDREIDRQRDAIHQEFNSMDECTRTALAYTALADDGRTLVNFGRSQTRFNAPSTAQRINSSRWNHKNTKNNKRNPATHNPSTINTVHRYSPAGTRSSGGDPGGTAGRIAGLAERVR